MNRLAIPIMDLMELNRLLQQPKKDAQYPDGVVREYSAELDAGYRASIRVINGDGVSSAPYAAIEFFIDGQAISNWHRRKLDGIYTFHAIGRRTIQLCVTGIARLVVAAANANGEPDLFFAKCIGPEIDFTEGRMHALAQREAESHGYEGGDLVYDEAGPYAAGFMAMPDWSTVPILESVVQLPAGHQWREIPSGSAQCFAWECPRCTQTFLHSMEDGSIVTDAEEDVCEPPTP